MLSLSKIDLPIFHEKGQPEKVHIAPIPQTETAHFLLLNWQEKEGYELESSNSRCTYPEINDSFGFLGKRFLLLNNHKQLIVKPTRDILIFSPVDSMNRC